MDKSSNSLKETISLKNLTLNNFASFYSYENTRLILITAAGIIEGDFSQVLYEKTDNENTTVQEEKSIHELLTERNHETVTEWENCYPNVQFTDKSPRIFLKNVVLSPISNPNTKINFNELFVFVDQVIGFYVGSMSVTPK